MKKRLFDIGMAGFLLIPSLPIMAVCGAVITVTTGRQPFFLQERVGKDGRPFILYKFRGMNDAVDENGNLLPAKDRLTRFGGFIRKYGLDELPQLLNILKGDMSIVGPRPRMYNDGDETQIIPPSYKEILQVRPGLTGPVQVTRMYRGEDLPLEEKLQRDWVYATAPENIVRDMRYVVQTLPVFILGNGAGIPVDSKFSEPQNRPR